MEKDMINSLVKSMSKYQGKERQHLVAGYYYDTFDDEAFATMPAGFFAGLLEEESDPICKWYEIKALGDLRAKEYVKNVIAVIKEENVKFETGSSLHAIAAGALGKMGADVVNELVDIWNDVPEYTSIAIIDALGETRSAEAVPVLRERLLNFNIREFNYAVLALVKCGTLGSTVLKEQYGQCDDIRKCLVIDALAKDITNDEFLQSVMVTDLEVAGKVLSMDTDGISQLKERILRCENNWTQEHKNILIG